MTVLAVVLICMFAAIKKPPIVKPPLVEPPPPNAIGNTQGKGGGTGEILPESRAEFEAAVFANLCGCAIHEFHTELKEPFRISGDSFQIKLCSFQATSATTDNVRQCVGNLVIASQDIANSLSLDKIEKRYSLKIVGLYLRANSGDFDFSVMQTALRDAQNYLTTSRPSALVSIRVSHEKHELDGAPNSPTDMRFGITSSLSESKIAEIATLWEAQDKVHLREILQQSRCNEGR